MFLSGFFSLKINYDTYLFILISYITFNVSTIITDLVNDLLKNSISNRKTYPNA